MSITSIETVSGYFVDLVNPDPETICIEDIAWAISRMPRYVGHTVSAIPYTIGQHSIYTAELVKRLFTATAGAKNCPIGLKKSFDEYVKAKVNPELAEKIHLLFKNPCPKDLLLETLLHDATEAYIVDVPTPLKMADEFRQVYLQLELQMMAAIRQKFNLPNPKLEYEVFVKWADQVALTIEVYHLIKSRGANWSRLIQLDMTTLQLFEAPREPIIVYDDFLNYFTKLQQE